MSDPSFVRACDYRWRLKLPQDCTVVSGGLEEHRDDDTWLIRAPRTRNLVAWISDRPVQTLSLAPSSGPVVRVSFIGKYTMPAALCLSVARDTLAIASEMFGPYPRRSFDVVFVPFTSQNVGGMEASGMTFIHQPMLTELDWRGDDPLMDGNNDLLHSVIHEVLHSWWYDQVGNDPGDEPWLDESLTEWSTWYVVERLRGRPAMQTFAGQRFSAMPLLVGNLVPLNRHGDQMNEMQFGLLVYGRGPLLYEALRLEAGDEALFAALRTWYRSHAGGMVYRADWDATFLPLLPADRRAAFVRSWIEGVEDPVPTALDRILPAGQAEQIRTIFEAARPQLEKPQEPAKPSAPQQPVPSPH